VVAIELNPESLLLALFFFFYPAFTFATFANGASVFIAYDVYALISTPGSKTGYALASGGVVGYATWSTVLKRNAKGSCVQNRAGVMPMDLGLMPLPSPMYLLRDHLLVLDQL
jgi:hypothetical protein